MTWCLIIKGRFNIIMNTEAAPEQPNDAKYYWLGDVILKRNSVILPGNWIRVVNSMPGHHLALREHVYEKVRLDGFADLPSRFTSSFICQGVQSAQAFRSRNGRAQSILYEVSVVDSNARRAILDSELLGVQNMNDGGRLLSVNELVDQARLYWLSNQRLDIAIPEVLVESSIKIISTIA